MKKALEERDFEPSHDFGDTWKPSKCGRLDGGKEPAIAFEAENAVAVLRRHGQSEIGITLIGLLERYDFDLKKKGGKLMTAGVDERIIKKWKGQI